jgi:peptidyl-prolyl cis-trans isomerase C
MTPNLLPRTTPRRRPIAFATLAALLFVLPVAAGCSKNSSSEAPAAGPDPVIARVNGVDIKQSDLALAEEDVGADMQAASPEAKREHLISYLADIIMVTQAADKKKLADNPDFKRRLAFLRNKLLMGYELQDEAKAALTDDALHQTYNDAVKSMGGQEEVHARHILVESEDEAKALLDQLKGGADFATLAKEKSKAGIRRCRLQDVSRPALEPGEDAVRLAHHQGGGQAHQAAAGIREGEGPDRGLPGAQGADRFHHQAAPEREGRAPG